MDAERINIYSACDKAIQAMNRWSLDDFGKLKLADWDDVNVIRTVKAVYTRGAKRARKRYYEVAFEAYLLALAMCEIPADKAHRMAEKAITEKWVDKVLQDIDFITMYRFDTETERKAYRLAETLEVSNDRDHEINKALRAWSQQLAQYALNVTDYAVIEAFEDAGIEEVIWISEKDGRECKACNSYNGKRFRIEDLPRKPHYGCRCHLVPVLKD